MIYQPNDVVVITRGSSKYHGKNARLVRNTGRVRDSSMVWEVSVDGVPYGIPAIWNEFREDSFALHTPTITPPSAQTVQKIRFPIITLKDAVLAEREDLKTRYGTSHIQQEWRKEGRCPCCGELGEYRISVPVCSNHGPY